METAALCTLAYHTSLNPEMKKDGTSERKPEGQRDVILYQAVVRIGSLAKYHTLQQERKLENVS